MRLHDTICAIATGAGGGIGIVRLSGPEAGEILAKLLRPWPAVPQSHRLYHAQACDPVSGAHLDDVLGCFMRGPRSYTGEDVGEVHGHGGGVGLGRLLRAAARAGARVAEPGEFTRRAFLNGRVDLSEAEAVAEVIAARTERALNVAQAQLRGAVREVVATARGELIEVLAELEVRVDFPDERLDFLPVRALAERLEDLGARMQALAETYTRGRLVRGGLDVALVGRANAGKSSLLNALVGEERALVDAAPGTTRDFVEAEIEVDGLRVLLVDTAGEREEGEAVERRGVELGRRRRRQADVVVVVVDGVEGYGTLEASLMGEEPGRQKLLVWNKSDQRAEVVGVPANFRVVATSAVSGEGIAALKGALRELADDSAADGEVVVTGARQHEALREAGDALAAGALLLRAGEPMELVAVDVQIALHRLGQVTGETVDSAVLDEIFARFCVGK